MIIEILTGILVLITGIYAYLTYRMAVASEESSRAISAQTEALTRPYVTVSPFVRPHTNILYLRIQNTGKSVAENVRLTLDRDFFQFGNTQPDRNLRSISAFAEVIDSMPPDFELLFALAQGPSLFGSDAKSGVTPTQFAVTASYAFTGKLVSEVTRIDLRPYSWSEGEQNPVVEELERLRKVLEKR